MSQHVRLPSPTVAADDHAVLYGAGFFESFHTQGGRPVRLAAHLARLHEACARIGIRIPATALAASADDARWLPAIAAALAHAGLSDGVIRLTVTAGPCAGPLGTGEYLAPQEFLTARPLPPPAPPEGIALHVLGTVRDTGEWRPRPKSLNYLNALLAARELAPRRLHPADEGLLLGASGTVAEAVFSNLIWVKAGALFTPHEDTGALPGVARAQVLAALRAAGGEVHEVLAPLPALLAADAVFTVSSVRGVVPVASVRAAAGVEVARYATAPAWLDRLSAPLR